MEAVNDEDAVAAAALRRSILLRTICSNRGLLDARAMHRSSSSSSLLLLLLVLTALRIVEVSRCPRCSNDALPYWPVLSLELVESMPRGGATMGGDDADPRNLSASSMRSVDRRRRRGGRFPDPAPSPARAS